MTTSHDHYDHNNIGMIEGDAKHIQGSGRVKIKDIEIMGVQTCHDECGEKNVGKPCI